MTLAIAAAEPATVQLDTLTKDAELSCRVRLDAATVEAYAEAMKAGATFPPIVVFRDSKGALFVGDGHHRVASALAASLTDLPADVRQGGRREALLHAAGSNAQHGLRRTQADVRRAIALVLQACPKHSDRKVASTVGCNHETVGSVRKALAESATPSAEGEPATLDLDRLVAKLSRALVRVFEQWPPERRGELRQLLDAADAGASLGPR